MRATALTNSEARGGEEVVLCPGLRESAGEPRTTATRKGNRWLRTVLVVPALGRSALGQRPRRPLPPILGHRGHHRPSSPGAACS
jgi:hypothetical protein